MKQGMIGDQTGFDREIDVEIAPVDFGGKRRKIAIR
jgi:hypothetical protein